MATPRELQDMAMRASEAGDEEAVAAIMQEYNKAVDFSGVEGKASQTPPTMLKTARGGMGRLGDVGLGFTADAYGGLGRGVRQLANMALGDKEKVAELQAEETKRRAVPVSPERELGRYLGVGSQFVIPGGAAARGASAAPRVMGMAVPALARTMAAEGAIAAGVGGAQPTVTGESNAANAKVSGVLGALGPVAAPIARGVGNMATGGKALLLRAAGRAADSFAESGARKAAAGVIEDVTSKVKVVIPRETRDELRGLLRRNVEGIEGDMRRKLYTLIEAGRKGVEVPGKDIAMIRSDLIKEAKRLGGSAENALYAAQRAVDAAADKTLNKIPPTVLQKLGLELPPARRLSEARTQYRTGKVPTKPSALRTGSQALVSELRRTSQAQQDDTGGY